MTTDSSPLIFLMGVTGQTGRLILEDFDNNASDVRVRIGVRKEADLERFRSEGRDAVLFDLDDPRTFGPALCGVDRMNILTGYTIAMTHQTKAVVDAAKKAGVRHIVNQGVIAAADATDSKYCWFALVEAYIEASGISRGRTYIPTCFSKTCSASRSPSAVSSRQSGARTASVTSRFTMWPP